MGLQAHFQLLMGLTGEWAEGGFHPAKPHPDLEDPRWQLPQPRAGWLGASVHVPDSPLAPSLDGVQHTHLDGVFLAHTVYCTAAPWLRAGGWSGFLALPS